MVNQFGAALGIAAAALLVAASGSGATIAAFRPAFWLLAVGVAAGLVASSRLAGRTRGGAPDPAAVQA
jgi:hypothetical protein